MKFTCPCDVLSNALTHVSRVVSSHAALDILKGLLIEAGENCLKITANNMENAVVTQFEADVEEEGSCVIEAKILCDIVRRLSGIDVSMSVDGNYQVTITSLLSEYSLMALPADKYPSLPEVAGLRILTLSQASLKS